MAAEGRVRPHGRLPLRRSLLVRLLAASITIAVCSVAATAWLAARTTTSAIQREQGQVLADDAQIYDTLVGYAAEHTDWSAVTPALKRLSARTGRHITLTTQDRRPVAASGTVSQQLPANASALVDPLRADPALLPGVQADGVDPRAVGPYRLPDAERKELRYLARKLQTCLRGAGFAAGVTEGASGRPSLVMTGDRGIQRKVGEVCGVFELDDPTRTEKRALDRLNTLVSGCLKRQRLDPVEVGLGFAPTRSVSEPEQRCVDTARREQLAPYVAPPALLFVTTPAGTPAAPGFDLSSANTAKVAGVAALVLVLTLAVTVTVGTRLVRPLRALTDAARHSPQEHLRVPVTTNDEIGHLAAAFNDLSERRERLEDQRKAMVSDVAHELRTPLSTIRGWLEAAQDGLAASDEKFVASLLEEALLLQHIVDDLQHLAQADAGRLRLHPEPLSLRELLDHVAAAHRGRAETAGVTLTTRIEDTPVLHADPARLRQSVGNLLSNAIRHTPPGGVVTLGCRGEGEVTVIEVADTGTGIAADDLPRVFDRFWRADRSRSRQTGGSGLGLAIVRQLVEAHGGTVSVTSTPGRETVFALRLPHTCAEALRTR